MGTTRYARVCITSGSLHARVARLLTRRREARAFPKRPLLSPLRSTRFPRFPDPRNCAAIINPAHYFRDEGKEVSRNLGRYARRRAVRVDFSWRGAARKGSGQLCPSRHDAHTRRLTRACIRPAIESGSRHVVSDRVTLSTLIGD